MSRTTLLMSSGCAGGLPQRPDESPRASRAKAVVEDLQRQGHPGGNGFVAGPPTPPFGSETRAILGWAGLARATSSDCWRWGGDARALTGLPRGAAFEIALETASREVAATLRPMAEPGRIESMDTRTEWSAPPADAGRCAPGAPPRGDGPPGEAPVAVPARGEGCRAGARARAAMATAKVAAFR